MENENENEADVANYRDNQEVINLDENDDNLVESEMDVYNETNETENNRTEIDLTDDNDQAENFDDGKNQSEMVLLDEWEYCGLESEPEDETNPRDMSYINPEDIERALLNLPTAKQLTDDLSHLKQSRKILVSPLTMADIHDEHIAELLNWETVNQFQTSFARDVQNPDTFVGIMNIWFLTSKSAAMAIDFLKGWKESLEVRTDPQSFKSMDTFIDKNGVKKRLTDNVAILKNLSSDVTEEMIRELFPNVEDVVLHIDLRNKKSTPNTKFSTTAATAASKKSPGDQAYNANPSETLQSESSATNAAADSRADMEAGNEGPKDSASGSVAPVLPSAPPKGYAYLVFPNEIITKAEVDAAIERKLELFGHKLLLLSYKAPVHAIPRTYLRLRERKAVMMHVERCSQKAEQLKENSKASQMISEKVALSRSVIEMDNKSRKDMGLPQPTLEQLNSMSGMPRLNSTLIQKTLTRYGIIKEKKPVQEEPAAVKKKFVEQRNKPYRGGMGGSNRRNTTPRRGRKSPYDRRDSGGGRRGYNDMNNPSGRHRNSHSQTSLLGNAALVNPLAQLVMQQNLLGGSGINPTLMGLQTSLGGTPMEGLLGNPFKGPGHDSRNQMIRLDETGNFRVDNESRYPGMSRHKERPQRPQRDDFRKRSRSPRSDFVRGDAGDDSVNLLLNLSQMLSNKMDQKRQQLENDKRTNYNRRYDY